MEDMVGSIWEALWPLLVPSGYMLWDQAEPVLEVEPKDSHMQGRSSFLAHYEPIIMIFVL